MLTRRNFCHYLAAAAAGSTLLDMGSVFSLARAKEYFSVKEIAAGHWVISGGGGNILLLQNGGQPLLIDAGVGALASELMDKVTGLTGSASCTLVNTHHHPDHIGGNYAVRQTFGKDVQVVAQDNLVPRVAETLQQRILPGLMKMGEENPELKAMAEALTADDFAPSHTFGKEHELKIGGTAAHLHHFGPGHTDNDLVVFLPQQNILHTGDLIFNELHPYVFAEHGATTTGWQKSLNSALELCDAETVVIPGHGELTDRSALVKMHDYFTQARQIVAAAIAEGRTREEVGQMKPEAFAGRGFAEVQHMTLNRIYDELTSH